MAHEEKARSNRTLIYGTVIIGGLILLVVAVILVAVLLSQTGM